MPSHNGWLGEQDAKDIARRVGTDGETFTCHNTLRRKKINRSHCAGAAILQERTGGGGDMLQIAERLGLYDADKLDMQAPVVKSWQAFIRLHKGTLRAARLNTGGTP